MKQSVIALLTITINRYSEVDAHILSQKNVINDLTNILDYIEDFKEKSIEESITSNSLEIIQLKKYIRELEDENKRLKEGRIYV
ncbi:hypothetical protein [Clostridium sporogenes]|uniref:hypothetical protein n=1 Tax=Clostridium sporogenes TaxID=1509 RepID=UPI001F2AC752|nr:hypothetical protein [Clostridium sporogenes]UJA30892.1 hypothetical protein L0894_12295 [Clostridium sporogenes]